MYKKRPVYQIPNMDKVHAQRDLVYKSAEGTDLKLDISYELACADDFFFYLENLCALGVLAVKKTFLQSSPSIGFTHYA